MSKMDQIEDSIAYAKEQIALGQRIARLEENPDFRELVGKMYLKDEAARIANLYGAGTMDAEQRFNLERDMYAIGAFSRFMRKHLRNAEQAQSDLAAAEYQREEQLAQEKFERENNMEPELPYDAQYANTLGA